MTKHEKKQAVSLLAEAYPDAKPALKFATPYELLIAVILSAQCTDERVNKVTAKLFEKYDKPEKMIYLFVRILSRESRAYSFGDKRHFNALFGESSRNV